MNSLFSESNVAKASVKKNALPSEPGVWLFIFGDLLVFGLLFGLYAHESGLQKLVFLQSQAQLDIHYGAANTLVLLSGSYFAALALLAARHGEVEKLTRFLMFTFFSGAVFLVIKAFEWSAKLGAGVTISTDSFFMYYFVLTGLHLVHVLIGMGLIGELWRQSRQGIGGGKFLKNLEGGAIYWHMVDLLWVVLFPLLYLMK